MNRQGIKTSFIVITWNGLHYIRSLFDSMRPILEREDIELVLIDNGSEDGTADYVRKFFPKIILLELPSNKGVAYARNRGMEICTGQYIFFLDNDMIIDCDVIDHMIDYMDKNPDVGLAGCKLRYGDGAIQESCKTYPGFIHKFKNLFHIGKLGYSYAEQMCGNEPFEPVYVIGACQLFRREAYEQVGNLDENIFYGPEDCDFCMRIKSKGWRIMYLPQYTLIHYCQRMTYEHPFTKMGIHHILGLLYFYWKNKRM